MTPVPRPRHAGKGLPGVVIAAILILTASTPSALFAQDETRELAVEPAIDVPITATLGAYWIATELAKPGLASESCRWCEPPGVDTWARDGLRWSSTETAAGASDILAYGALPVFAVATGALITRHRDGTWGDFGTDSLLVLQAVSASAALTQTTKLLAARERPFVHALDPGAKAAVDHAADNNLSFFSGHTSLAFSTAVATGTVATLRDYDHAWLVWSIGITAASTVGYFRIAADRHYLTDVLAGAAVGSLAGAVIPLLHHQQAAPTNSTVAIGVNRGPSLAIMFEW